MSQLDLTKLSVSDARLVQHGLKALGYYNGTTRGKPGPLTKGAYARYLEAQLPEDATKAERSTIPLALVEILKGEIGVREVPRNSNRGKRVEEYQAASWLDGTGWPWCAAFICWGIREVAKQHDLPFKRPQTAGAWDFERWAREEGVRIFKPRQRIWKGDIVVFTFSHIGLAIADESNGMVTTVEGNTDSSGSREGGGVYRKRRKTSQVRSHIRLELA